MKLASVSRELRSRNIPGTNFPRLGWTDFLLTPAINQFTEPGRAIAASGQMETDKFSWLTPPGEASSKVYYGAKTEFRKAGLRAVPAGGESRAES